MVNPAFSESQLKNLRRQNRHLASTHRRKLVFLQASRNPAHGSGRPFFVRDVPVPASFCSVPVASPFAPPAPVSAAPQLRPFCRPHRFCLRLPASPARRTELVFVLCTLPFRIPARHPGNGPARHLSARPLSLRPSPLRLPLPPLPSSDRSAVPSASALVFQPLPHAGQSSVPYCACCRSASPPGTPGTVPPASFCPAFAPTAPGPCRSPAPAVPPSPPLLPSSSSLSRTPDRVRIRSVRAAVPHPRPAPRERSRPASFCPAPVASAFAPPAPASAAPQLRPFCRPFRFCPRLPASPARRAEFGSVLCVLPFRIPTRHAGNGPSGIFLSGLRPYGSRPLPLPSSGRSAVPSASALVFQPLPHAGQSSDSFCARCRSASPPGTPGTVPSRNLSVRPLSLRPSPLGLPLP